MTRASKKTIDAETDWRPEPDAIEALVSARHGDPFAVLGPHPYGEGISIRVLAPSADAVDAVDAHGGQTLASLERLDDRGFFCGLIDAAEPSLAYRLRFRRGDAHWEADDPYRFPAILGELDVHLLAEGRHRRLYEKLGAHPACIDDTDGVAFAVWAPNARRISVVGDFNNWDGRRHPMRKRHEAGVWELFVPGVPYNAHYKFEILGDNGELLPLKTDPFGFQPRGTALDGLARARPRRARLARRRLDGRSRRRAGPVGAGLDLRGAFGLLAAGGRQQLLRL